MKSKIKTLLEWFEKIEIVQKDLQLREITSPKWQRLPSTSLVVESEVFGRDNDKETVIKLLMSDNEKISVIPIVGMGGIGKTTLAQAVFNHYKVIDKFELKAWVCVSEKFDVWKVTKTILKTVAKVTCDNDEDLNSLQVKLKESLFGKKFLIVLDDVWEENDASWEVTRLPFMNGAQGSKIIVTTRSQTVASVMGTPNNPAYCLDVLTEEASWQLFSQHAFRNFLMNPNLERIGREIVKKCNGLPLAVKTLGGLLRFTPDIDYWERVLTNDIWTLKDEDSVILPSLRLSYHYLPSQLKRCFAYCSIFPKDYKFEKENLILLWMAENLLEQPKGNESIEEVGDRYFNNLVSRSFFQRRSYMGSDSFVMHDLIVDLANFVSGKYYFRLRSRNPDGINVKKEIRYLACDGREISWETLNSIILEATGLRTFILLNPLSYSEREEGDLFLKLKNLRVLSLNYDEDCNNFIDDFIDSVCKLRHLRFLDLSYTPINNLPNSFCTLYNLQTLKLANCWLLSKLPNDFCQLRNLRYLDASDSGLEALPEALCQLVSLQKLNLSGCGNLTRLPEGFHHLINLRYLNIEYTGLEAMPTQISKLKSLRTLSTFIVGEDTGSKLSELGALSKISETLDIKNLQNVVREEDALEAKLREKHLEDLSFDWANQGGANDSEQELRLLSNLIPNTSLITLNIIGYGGQSFPIWVCNQSFCNIVDAYLSNCKNCVTLPPLGQLPSLKKLSISGFEAVVTVGAEFFGSSPSTVKPFASLEELNFSDMQNWKEWKIPNDVVDDFPKLRKLSLERCNSLTGDMPCSLPSLTTLKICVSQLPASSVRRMPKATSLTPAEALESYSNLQNLHIEADSLSLQFKCLPSALKTLSIKCVKSFEFQLQQKSHDSLEELSLVCLKDFGRLSFALDFFPNIKRVDLHRCEILESLWLSSNGLSNCPGSTVLPNLTSLKLSSCKGLIFLPDQMQNLPNLTSLSVSFCKDLKFLPEKMHNLLPSLQYLYIMCCSELELFPVMGLPSSLRKLVILNCDKLMASWRNWNLERLPNLTELDISFMKCEDMESFPEEGLLPTTVREIEICSIGSLKILNNKGLQQLTSFERLYIASCPKLEMMTEEALPATQYSLVIQDCPLLEDKCDKTGEYWNRIAHIPRITLYTKTGSKFLGCS